MVALIAVGTVLTGFLLPRDLLYAAKLAALLTPTQDLTMKSSRIVGLDSKDPPLGTVLPNTKAARAIKRLAGDSQRGVLIMALGDCSECTTGSLEQWNRDAQVANIPLYAFTLSSVRDIAAFAKQSHTTVHLVPDEDNKLHTAVNGYFAGRLYYFDRNWRLRWRMTPGESFLAMSGIPTLLKQLPQPAH